MSNKFDNAVLHTLAHEGIFSNDANDRGGKTKYGITHGTLKTYQNKTGRLPGRRIEDLTRSEAIDIYKALYWRYDGVASQMIATKLFDIGVNTGLTVVVRIVQQAINFHPRVRQIATRTVAPVDVDGLWGPATLNAINALSRSDTDRHMLFQAMALFQAKRYCDIVTANPTQLDFIGGWLKRAAAKPKD